MTSNRELEIQELEERLLALGRRELEAENRIQRLRKRCREAGEAGRAEEADMAWTLLEEARSTLTELQALIMKVETRLYGLRRHHRH